jgi:hypothetical protein
VSGDDGVVTRGRVAKGIGPRLLRVLGIVLVFVLIGPPLGAFLLFLTIGAMQLLGSDPKGLAWVALFAIIYAVPLSYLFGAIPAAAAGLMIGIWQVFVGRTTWLIAAGVGVIVGAAVLYSGDAGSFDAAPDEHDFRAYPPLMVLTCVAATVLCWLVVRNWYAAKAGTSGNNP